MIQELKTAADVRKHARLIQRKIDQQRGTSMSPPPPPPRDDDVPMEPMMPDEIVIDENCAGIDQPLHSLAPALKGRHPTRVVFALAADYFGFKLREVMGKSRVPNLVLPRQIGFYVARRLGASYPKIGLAARRDHTTILHGCKVIAQRIREDDMLAQAVDVIGAQAAAAFGASWSSVRETEQAP